MTVSPENLALILLILGSMMGVAQLSLLFAMIVNAQRVGILWGLGSAACLVGWVLIR